MWGFVGCAPQMGMGGFVRRGAARVLEFAGVSVRSLTSLECAVREAGGLVDVDAAGVAMWIMW